MHFQSFTKDLRNRSKKMVKHTFQENYEKIFGSIKEGWWDDLSDKGQQAYIDKHGSAPGIVQQATKGGGEGPHEPDEPVEDKPEKQQDTASSPAGTRTGDESTEELGDMIKQQQNHIEDMAERGEPEEDIQAAEADREEMEQEMEEKEAADEEEMSKEEMSRTGNELNQETLMIDGKQYRRISEVEQEPKYEFSEFYRRFKKQE